MHLLALETSTEYCSCALSVSGVVHEACVQAGHTHSQRLLPMVAELMAQAGLVYGQLDAIAFGAGPGSFTGLRIACGAAQGLAFAHDLPVVPVSTLEALAAATGGDRVLACLDARMGELYLAAYERGGPQAGWTTVQAQVLARVDGLPPLDGAWLGVGSGFAAHAQALAGAYSLSGVQADLFPRAGAVARLALDKLARGEGVAAEAAAPLYLRDKVALDTSEQAALRAARAVVGAGA
jgi:tRNA threonylcarbamoyladenosine biosynthesis protein TsaB